MKDKNNVRTTQEVLRCKKVTFYLNGQMRQTIVKPGMTLLELLHENLRMYGTKLTCNEGDCGACTVIIGMRKNTEVLYQAVNSCIYPALRIHNKHLITIEGIGTPENLHPVQEALLDFHGTQCGYCTPGFVMALISLFINNPEPKEKDIFTILEGNLCRCTGYDSIYKAAVHLKENLDRSRSLLSDKIESAEERIGNNTEGPEDIQQENRELLVTTNYMKPETVEELLAILHNFGGEKDFALLNGGTDLLVQANVNRNYCPNLIDIAEIKELDYIQQEENSLRIGATVTLSKINRSPLISEKIFVLVKTISLMASEQIRNMATIAGNIGNASPVADSVPVLLVLDAELKLVSLSGKRVIKLSDYYLDYKKTVLQKDELIVSINIPLVESEFKYQDMQKASKRRAVDISTVNSAISFHVDDGKLRNVRLAFGGVAVYPALAKMTMAFLEGKKFEKDWFAEAAKLAEKEFSPIDDVRGRAEYRKIIVRNQTLHFLNNGYELYLEKIREWRGDHGK